MQSPEEILAKIDRVISHKREHNLWNHFLTALRIDGGAISGEMTQNKFRLWKYCHWVGIFYPVIHGDIYNVDKRIRVDLRAKMNPFGRLVSIILLAGLGYVIITGVILQTDNSWTYLWKRAIAGIFIFCIPIFVLGLAYRHEYNKQIEEIKNVCQQRI